MFDKDIAMASYQGVKLHRQDGREYWKLRLTCTHESCPNEIEMGECLCFSIEEAMMKARDTHGIHCSAKCWAADTDDKKVSEEIAKARKWYRRELDQDEREHVEFTTNLDLVDEHWQWEADLGCCDGSEFYDEYDVEECPI